jgi:hypothetical protein
MAREENTYLQATTIGHEAALMQQALRHTLIEGAGATELLTAARPVVKRFTFTSRD